MAEPTNLLRHETSPYWLQHADNPVHWRPSGAAAPSEAAAADKPIMLSIGYPATLWESGCHADSRSVDQDRPLRILQRACSLVCFSP